MLETDPKDAKTLALTIKVTNMERVLCIKKSALAADGDVHKFSGKRTSRIEGQRKAKTSDAFECGRKVWHWCLTHVYEGEYDGLYVTYPTLEHGAWTQKK